AWDNNPSFVQLADLTAADSTDAWHLIKVDFKEDLLGANLSQADILIVARPERFGSLHEVRERLQPALLKVKPGVRIVSTLPLFPDQMARRVEPFRPPDDPGRPLTLYLFVTPLD